MVEILNLLVALTSVSRPAFASPQLSGIYILESTDPQKSEKISSPWLKIFDLSDIENIRDDFPKRDQFFILLNKCARQTLADNRISIIGRRLGLYLDGKLLTQWTFDPLEVFESYKKSFLHANHALECRTSCNGFHVTETPNEIKSLLKRHFKNPNICKKNNSASLFNYSTKPVKTLSLWTDEKTPQEAVPTKGIERAVTIATHMTKPEGDTECFGVLLLLRPESLEGVERLVEGQTKFVLKKKDQTLFEINVRKNGQLITIKKNKAVALKLCLSSKEARELISTLE